MIQFSYGTDDQFERLAEGTTDMSLLAVWTCLDDYLPGNFNSFEYRRDAFLWVLERLLKEDRIKLVKDGTELNDTPEALVELFRKAWPESENVYPDSPDAYFGLWFFDDDCPAGVMWLNN